MLCGGGSPLIAKMVGRDAGTNIAALRLAEPHAVAAITSATPEPGALAFAFGVDNRGEITVRMGVVNFVGPEWHSRAGGRIDARIVLDIRLSQGEEGGPVLDAKGACIGFSTFGPAGQVLVIPTATVERTPPAPREMDVARGWLGVALHPVAVPDALQQQSGQASGLMVMSLVDTGPAAKAGIVAGDIVLSVDGTPARRFRRLAMHLGPESVGRTVTLRVIRGGTVVSLPATIEARPSA
jgi:S1-C subfamily serine protease